MTTTHLPMQKQFHKFIQKQALFSKTDKLLVGVSGGVDSMVLIDLLKKGAYHFIVAHCNYQLRGQESDDDEQLVVNWCKLHDVECFVKKVQLEKKSIQLEAREARFEWFQWLSDERGCNKIVLAHHLNDVLESTLMNLVKGTGIRGITGIKASNGNRVRPLVFASKEQIISYARENGVEWREDASNQKNDYDRNFVRNEVVSRLETLNPSLLATFYHTNERLSLASQFIEDQVQTIRGLHFLVADDTFRLDTNWIEKTSDLVVLNELLADFGFNYQVVKQIFDARKESGKRFFAEEFELLVDRDQFFIQRYQEKISEETLLGVGTYKAGDHTITLEVVDQVEAFHASVAYLDAATITFPLILRRWHQGDKFKPLGMKGHKKVSDYLIDLKIPMHEKEKTLVVTSGADIGGEPSGPPTNEFDQHPSVHPQVVWLVGHQIDDRYKVADATKSILKLSVSANP